MRFDLLYADPPWSFENKRTGGSLKSGSSQQYDVIDTHTLANLDGLYQYGPHLQADNAILALWATVPLLQDGLIVMKSWGFAYKTTLFWRKTGKRGMGFWLRNQVECLLIGVRGKMKPWRLSRENVVECPALGHSEKPEIFRQILMEGAAHIGWAPEPIELFARREVPGWTCTGLELDGVNVLTKDWWRGLLPTSETCLVCAEEEGNTAAVKRIREEHREREQGQAVEPAQEIAGAGGEPVE